MDEINPIWASTSRSNSRPPSLLMRAPENWRSTGFPDKGKRSKIDWVVSEKFRIIVQRVDDWNTLKILIFQHIQVI
jgi:hypothetical protein